MVSQPTCIAHLHCPPLIPALAAEVLISATNQSMDSWDQSPAATVLEQQLVNWLCQKFGYPAIADGVFTSGGTQSNFMGLLLARDRFCQTYLNWSAQKQGLPPEAPRFRILCSEVSHFTIRQAAALLGLGEQAVVPVKTDAAFRLCPTQLAQTLEHLKQENLIPIALVATVGTTDFGSIDPLPEMATIAQTHNLWLHVDAAYGGALVLSDRHRSKLAGIEAADSITVDFHKLFYQPISCGAFLLKDRVHFDLIKLHADYLNPESNQAAGIPDLVTKSVQTTRRFDALKLWISLQNLGQQGFATMIDTTIDLAIETARLIAANRRFELANPPMINAVVFRYCPTPLLPTMNDPIAWSNQVNRQIRTTLMQRGQAVLAQTQIGDRVYLKFTLLNPRTTLDDISNVLNWIQQLGQALE
ncbi:pyridoxal phosphate-dependent decarboxylase family protein [Kovacikia minuta]|uniref:pyridoxal phosphate-dependent decarboxylase family protein n=1 Tax=Kovacikia minuta TaxID=2931930 RepID=UPI0020C7EDFB|nr:aspartate aminotransferase family protein [Kovacikia minuta]